ncbi:MAG: hypothetical protein FJ109_01180 [Deltaproteobacteria bacterium]|nr:hypothetical protein [Deltaproteobacteria bacterium]
MRKWSFFVLFALAGVPGCMDKGLTVETAPSDAVDALDGTLVDGNGSALDSTVPGDSGDTAGPKDAAADLPGKPDVPTELAPDTASEEVFAGPTCYEGLQCLVDMKTWTPGKPIPQGGCLEGISESEMAQVDDLMGCVGDHCKAEFEAFDQGGAAQLSLLYVCLIEKCALPTAVCIGGHGDKNCADALYCMAACPPLDQGCTIPCLQPTSVAQSQKTGKFLDCVFQECTLQTLSGCDAMTSCAVFNCMELAG